MGFTWREPCPSAEAGFARVESDRRTGGLRERPSAPRKGPRRAGPGPLLVLLAGRVPGRLSCLPLCTLERTLQCPGRLGRSAAEQNSQMGPQKSPARYTVSTDHRPQTGRREQHTLTLTAWRPESGLRAVAPVRFLLTQGGRVCPRAPSWRLTGHLHGHVAFSPNACVQISPLCGDSVGLSPPQSPPCDLITSLKPCLQVRSCS